MTEASLYLRPIAFDSNGVCLRVGAVNPCGKRRSARRRDASHRNFNRQEEREETLTCSKMKILLECKECTNL